MAERVHYLDGGQTRITVKAFKNWVDLGLYLNVSWGGESIREIQRRKSNNWWNPFSWGYEWVRADPPQSFTVQFFDAGGSELTDRLGPVTTRETGYLKTEVFLVFWGSPRPIGGVDARDVRRVVVRYDIVGVGPQELVQT